jgi:Flp pilus assembly pilin Flp
MIEFISSIFRGEAGPIEYSLITALVSVTAFATLTG